MRDIHLGEKTVTIQASALTPFIYEDEFGKDLMGVLQGMDGGNVSITTLIRLLWAEVKTADKKTKSFEPWLASLGETDLVVASGDDTSEWVTGCMEEVQHAFLGEGAAAPSLTKVK